MGATITRSSNVEDSFSFSSTTLIPDLEITLPPKEEYEAPRDKISSYQPPTYEYLPPKKDEHQPTENYLPPSESYETPANFLYHMKPPSSDYLPPPLLQHQE